MHYPRTSLLGLMLLVATPLLAADPAPDKDKENDKEKAPPRERVVKTGQAVGTINNWNETEGKFTLHVKIKYLAANQGALQAYQRDLQGLLQRQQNIATMRNPAQRQQETLKLAQDLANFQNKPQNFYTVKEREQDIEVELVDDAKIRVASPPVAFDDKGNAKAYTPEELKELKGKGDDAKLPGYAADRDALRNGQTVLVTTGYKVAAKPPKLEAEGGDKKKADEDKKKPDEDKKDGEKKMPPRPKLIQVLVLAEPKQ